MSDEYDKKEVDNFLKKIAKGTGLVLIGTAISTVLGFFIRLIIIRSLSQVNYGVFSLSWTVFSIFITLAAFGLPAAVVRFIARYRGKGNKRLVKGAVVSGLQIVVFVSLLSAAILFFTSQLFANLFNVPELSTLLKLWALAVPFWLVTGALIDCFRGFDDVKPKVIFGQMLQQFLKISTIILVVLFIGTTTKNIVAAYLFSVIVTGIAIITYAVKKLKAKLHGIRTVLFRKRMIRFAIPMILISVIGLVLAHTDTFMLGLFLEPAKVGLYSGAYPLARHLPMVLGAVGMLYFPISSFLFGKKKLKDLSRVYKVATKWILTLTLPIFLILFLFPEIVLSFLYGTEYAGAAMPLRLLSIAFFFHAVVGPNGQTLIAKGEQKTVMYLNSIAAIINIILNLVLIPYLGITGAALATATSYILMNILMSFLLYHKTKIHPFTKSYIKPLIASMLVSLIIYLIADNLLMVTFWMLPFLLIIFLVIYAAALFVTKSFDKEDIMMLKLLEKKSGLKLPWLRNLIQRFL